MMARLYIGAAAAMLAGVGILVAMRATPGSLAPALMGCALASANGLAAALVNRRALGREMESFLLWVGIGHGVRMLALLLAVVGAFVYHLPGAGVLAAATLIGYVCFLAAEIASLRQRT
ncbi:MAG: hypothetical protein K8T26_20575 [Lentisphaerae bacterium]|nr:hypothetical protein [Lentisphaerota bacterium]